MNRVNVAFIDLTDDYLYVMNGQPFTGIAYEPNDDGVIISEIEFRNGVQAGITRGFFPTGVMKRESEYEYNTLHGFAREWNEEGVLESECEYERGICLRRRMLDSTGQLTLYYELQEGDPQFATLQLLRNARFISR